MKTLEKDILLICKGHYDTEKYKLTKDAMDKWYREKFEIDIETMPHISYKFYVECFLPLCVKEFLNERTIGMFCDIVLKQGSTERLIYNNKEIKDVNHVLFIRITEWLASLQVKDGEQIYIDLSDYRVNGEIINLI